MKKRISFGLFFTVVLVLFGMMASLSGTDQEIVFNQSDTLKVVQDKLQNMRNVIKQEGYSFEVGLNPAMQYPLEDLCGFNPDLMDQDFYKYEKNESDLWGRVQALPASYMGYYTSIKNQGACGSCWAFSMTAEVESTAKRLTGTTYDLSEQYVLNCTSKTWGCNGGFFNYVTFIPPKGARAESCLPYVAKKNKCYDTCPIVYQITGWAYVGTSSSVPSVDAIKTAILTYGAVGAAVYVDSYWQAYSSGCFDRNAAGSCNHAIQLVGWDDSLCSGGAWRLKNSWGTGWGESGFMWIKYGSQLVGYAACYSY